MVNILRGKWLIIVPSFLIVVMSFLIGCSNDSKEDASAVVSTESGEHNNVTNWETGDDQDSRIENLIEVNWPMTISRNDLFPVTSEQQTLVVRLVNGKYYEDWSPGPFMGRNWTGDFEMALLNEQDETISKVNLNDFFSESIRFIAFFKIEFDDYNNDGNIDFTIGQYGTSNGNYYKLFTIEGDQFKELKVKDRNELFITSDTGMYSTKLEKVKPKSIKKNYYDNSTGQIIEESFSWENGEFVMMDRSERPLN